MKRGEIWTVAGGRGYAGKPRPAVILQADEFDRTDSITTCLLTTVRVDAPDFRIAIAATRASGLREESFAMIDKVSTIERQQIGQRIGHVDPEELAQINTALMVFLGLT
ncbi:MAG: type II toxin-antitoxin system PemK/MazF family toxin [Novosphingobium sp.]